MYGSYCTCSRIVWLALLIILITFATATQTDYVGTVLAWIFLAIVVAMFLLIDLMFMDDKCFVFEVDRKVRRGVGRAGRGAERARRDSSDRMAPCAEVGAHFGDGRCRPLVAHRLRGPL